MAKDVADVVGTALGRVARETVQSVSANARKRSSGPLSGANGVLAGAGLVALAPLAAKGTTKLVRGIASNGADPLKHVGEGVKGAVVDKAGQAAKSAGKGMLPGAGGGSKGGKSQGVPGVGKGRRMPFQQDIDIGAPVKTVYNQWTQFEEWPKFMHRLQQVTQEDDTHVSFKAKVWGISREFKAEILEQRPDERIKWRVNEGLVHQGVVTFHELAPRLTRVEVNFDIEPGGLIEKAARGMRHIKRAARADLARFKAYVLMEEEESGAWRGQIDDGDVKRKSSSGSRRSSGGTRRSSSNRSKASSSNRARSSSSGSRSTASSSRSRSTSARSRGSSNGRSSSARRSGSSSGRRSRGSR